LEACGGAKSLGLAAIFAIVAVTDIALNAQNGAMKGRDLAKHHRLPRRHLGRVLQALARKGI
jgi:DNA-binding IscR family transcriptional regulator